MKNNDVMKYKGYTGSIDYSNKDNVFYGKVLGIKSLLLYEGETLTELEEDFHSFVDDYINYCEENNLEKEKPYKGSTNVRIEPDIYESVSRNSKKMGISINKYINVALAAFICNEKRYIRKYGKEK